VRALQQQHRRLWRGGPGRYRQVRKPERASTASASQFQPVYLDADGLSLELPIPKSPQRSP
jgi:hypothetical protein